MKASKSKDRPLCERSEFLYEHGGLGDRILWDLFYSSLRKTLLDSEIFVSYRFYYLQIKNNNNNKWFLKY